MKKYLLFALMTIMSFTASAQFVCSPLKNNETNKAKVCTSNKAEILNGTDIWGYYLGDANGYSAIGFNNQSAGRYAVAIYVPGDGFLKGAKLCGVNIPGFATSVSNITIWALDSSGDEYIAKTDFTGEYNANGYMAAPFEKEIVIPAEGLYVGYSFDLEIETWNDYKPFAIVKGTAKGSLYIGNDDELSDYSSAGYISAMQVFVKDMNLYSNGVSITSAKSEACAINAKGQCTVQLSSDNHNEINAVEYALTVNGIQTTGTKILSPSIPAGFNKKGSFTFEYDAPAEIGVFDASIAITKVNYANNEITESPTPFTVSTVTRVVPRMTVVEENTGVSCGYCPRGLVGMEAIKKNQNDKALAIIWHGFSSASPMYQKNYASLNFEAAPECSIDRKVKTDPYYGIYETGIMNDVSEFNKTTPTVDVKLKAYFVDDTNTNVNITADTEFLANTKDYTIAFVLTADELKGTTTEWKQENRYYNTEDDNVLPSMPELAKFYKNGEYGEASVFLTFNDVMIGSTYDATGKSTVPAFTKGKAGDIETSEATIGMPTKEILVNALHYDKIYATVLVIDNYNHIANAARVRVLSAEEAVKIDNVEISDITGKTNAPAIYNIYGQQVHNMNSRGLYIKNGKKVYIK